MTISREAIPTYTGKVQYPDGSLGYCGVLNGQGGYNLIMKVDPADRQNFGNQVGSPAFVPAPDFTLRPSSVNLLKEGAYFRYRAVGSLDEVALSTDFGTASLDLSAYRGDPGLTSFGHLVSQSGVLGPKRYPGPGLSELAYPKVVVTEKTKRFEAVPNGTWTFGVYPEVRRGDDSQFVGGLNMVIGAYYARPTSSTSSGQDGSQNILGAVGVGLPCNTVIGAPCAGVMNRSATPDAFGGAWSFDPVWVFVWVRDRAKL